MAKFPTTAFGIFLLAACGASPERTAEAELAPTAGAEEPMGKMCPMGVEEVEVSAAEINQGAAFVFTTSDPEEVRDLRERVGRMAQMHNRMHPPMEQGLAAHVQEGGPGQHAPGPQMGRMHTMHRARATASQVPGGARLELRADDPAQLDDLRQAVRMAAQGMQQGECPMMMQMEDMQMGDVHMQGEVDTGG